MGRSRCGSLTLALRCSAFSRWVHPPSSFQPSMVTQCIYFWHWLEALLNFLVCFLPIKGPRGRWQFMFPQCCYGTFEKVPNCSISHDSGSSRPLLGQFLGRYLKVAGSRGRARRIWHCRTSNCLYNLGPEHKILDHFRASRMHSSSGWLDPVSGRRSGLRGDVWLTNISAKHAGADRRPPVVVP